MLAIAGTASAGKKPPVDQGNTKDHKVLICHFAGHDGDAVITGRGFGCENNGGEILDVSVNGAVNGHGIDPDDLPE
jgi:hypothetical protein